MKLGKEEIQKLVLGILILCGAVYSYFTMLLFPTMAKQEALQKSISALGPEISKAKAQIAKTKKLESEAPAKLRVVPQVQAMIPEGSPIAWFPPRIADLFKRQGVEKATSRLNSEAPQKDLPGFRRMSWSVDISRVEFPGLGQAICALENEDPLSEIANIQIEVNREDVESQHALITLNNLTKQ
jgi:hypothetical protein